MNNQYENFLIISAALLQIVVITMIVERGLAFIFEFKWIDEFFAGLKKKGSSWPSVLKAIIAFGTSYLICKSYNFDILSVLFYPDSPKPDDIGTLITAFVVAGGSVGAIKLFQDYLGLSKDLRDSHLEAKNQQAENEKIVLQRDTALLEQEKAKAEAKTAEALAEKAQFNAKVALADKERAEANLSKNELEVVLRGTSPSVPEMPIERFHGVGIYIAKNGDSLENVAERHGINFQDLMTINPQVDKAGKLYSGQPINLSAAEKVDVSPATLIGKPDVAWFEIAKQEEENDIREISGGEHNPRIIEYHQTTSLKATDDETPWCSSFVNWCMEKAGYSGTGSAAARSWLKWGEQLDAPRTGCLVVLKRGKNPTQGHVGFYWADKSPRILLLGGNQGNEVSISSYSKADVIDYRWPKTT